MKKYIYQIMIMVLFGGTFVACTKNWEPNGADYTVNRGYIEYQFNDTLKLNGVIQYAADGVTPRIVKGLKRVILTDAVYAVHDPNTLPDTVKAKGLRQVEVFLLSNGGDYKNTIQPAGVSMTQISLVDTLNDLTRSILPMVYTIQSTANIYKVKKSAATSVTLSINRLSASYETTMLGILNDRIVVIDLSNGYYKLGTGIYQLIASGTYSTNTYKVFYQGTIRRESPYKL